MTRAVIALTIACVIATPILLLLLWRRPQRLRVLLAIALGLVLLVLARKGIAAVSFVPGRLRLTISGPFIRIRRIRLSVGDHRVFRGCRGSGALRLAKAGMGIRGDYARSRLWLRVRRRPLHH
jgi:hypothetical protein